MTPGLVHGRAYTTLATSRATVQLCLLDDTSELSAMQEQLRQSEAAYDGLCEDYQDLQRANGQLRREVDRLTMRVAELEASRVPRAVVDVLCRAQWH